MTVTILLLVCAAICLFLATQADDAPRGRSWGQWAGLTGEWAGIPVYVFSFLLFIAAGVSTFDYIFRYFNDW